MSEPKHWTQSSIYHAWFHHIKSCLESGSVVKIMSDFKDGQLRTGAIWEGLVYAQLRRHRYLWTVSSHSLIKVTTKLLLPVSHYVYTPRTTNCHCKSQTAYLWQCWLMLMIFYYFPQRWWNLELIWVSSAWVCMYFSNNTVLHTHSHIRTSKLRCFNNNYHMRDD